MFKLNQDSGKNCFIITDRDGCQIFGTKEELEELCQQIGKIKYGLPQKKESSHTVILEDDSTNKEVQMELSDSAYRLLRYLYNDNWFRSDNIHLIEVNDINFKNFV